MNNLWLFVGAVIVAYWVSRLLIRLTGTRRNLWGLVGVHVVAFLALAGSTGLIRRGMLTFDYWSIALFGVAAALWLRYDLVRRKVN